MLPWKMKVLEKIRKKAWDREREKGGKKERKEGKKERKKDLSPSIGGTRTSHTWVSNLGGIRKWHWWTSVTCLITSESHLAAFRIV